MNVKEKVNQYIDYKGINVNAFESSIGASKSYWRNTKNISAEILAEIVRVYSDLSAEWLLRGEGNMLKSNNNLIGSNQGNDNTIEYNNGGNVGVGNTVNVSLPEAGTQKIISPDGGIEINQSNPSVNELEHKIEMLEAEVSHLNNNIETKDKLIASLERTIELLGHRQ